MLRTSSQRIRPIPKKIREEVRSEARRLYVTGYDLGKADFVNGKQAKLPTGIDLVLIVGYIDGFEGWRIATRNEERKARK